MECAGVDMMLSEEEISTALEQALPQHSPTFLWVPWILVALIGLTCLDPSLFIITIFPILLLGLVGLAVFPLRLLHWLMRPRSVIPSLPVTQHQDDTI